MAGPSRILVALSILVTAAGCAKLGSKSDKAEQPVVALAKPAEAETSVLLLGIEDVQAFKAKAAALGLSVTGEVVLEVSGPVHALNALRVSEVESFAALEDERLDAVLTENAATDPSVLYLARRDFDLPAHLAVHPTHDGRGVTVGIIDDGISPNVDGFQTTTTGERKFLRRNGNSTLLKLPLASTPVNSRSTFASSYADPFDALWQGEIVESQTSIDYGPLDLNGDESHTNLAVAVFQRAGSIEVCVDSLANATVDADECFGTFAETGEFGYWTVDRLITFFADFDSATGTLSLSQGERSGDSHGEGVMSVLAGHRMGGQFDGVAPGAKIVDYDLGEASTDVEESRYTLGTFTRALDWLGQSGAEVVNISYSLFFHSAKAQEFMRDALTVLVERHNFVVSFSAGNNGPGLSSFNRGLLYPKTALVAGAFVSRDLDAHVHGVTGLPEPGRVVWYSSRGPAPDGATSPTVISPLASLTHRDPTAGFGAFSGTSSASPALAGLATVLISAAKQEGLPVDASAVVHAIRLSGVPLADTPFVFQGAGLPKIGPALAAYRRLVSGDDFAYLQAKAAGPGNDGVARAGVFLKTSSASEVFATSVSLQGKLATSVPPARNATILKPVRLEYSHPWLVGTERLFVAAGASSFHLEVRVADAMVAASGATEIFGEIRILDDATSAVLHVVPVTIVDDAPLTASRTFKVALAAEDGQRHHVHVPTGVGGMRVKVRVLQGDAANVSARIYDPSSAAVGLGNGEGEWLYPTTRSGWWQVTLARWGGTPGATEAEVTVEPVSLTLGTTVVSTSSPTIKIVNAGERQDLAVVLTPAPTLVQESLVEADLSGEVQVVAALPAAGDYYAEVGLGASADVRLWRPDCKLSKLDALGARLVTQSAEGASSPLTFAAGDHLSLMVSCRAFESNDVPADAQLLLWQVKVFAKVGDKTVAQGIARLEPGATDATVTWSTPAVAGQAYDVSVSPLFNDQSRIKLGTIKAL